MLNIKSYFLSGFTASVTTLVTLGLFTGPAFATGSFEEFDEERVVKVNCDKGRSVSRVLERFANRTKPLVLVIKGECINDDEDIEVNRDNVSFIGDESLNGHIPVPVIVNARGFNLLKNMRLDSLTFEYASKGEISIEGAGTITIDNQLYLNNQSTLDMYIAEEVDEEEESMLIDEVGSISVGSMLLQTQSLASVQQQETGGSVYIGEIDLYLQSSLKIDSSIVDSINLKQDSHAVLGNGVGPEYSLGSISCDSESRVWGETGGFNVFDPVTGIYCKGD